MPISLIPSFLFYCLVSGITPGPANLCSLSAALKYGRKDAIKQWRGLFVGYAVVSISSVFIIFFMGRLFHRYVNVLSLIGAIYIIYLAIHMLFSMKKQQTGENRSDCNFWSGFFVQVTNVKVMVFCLTALTAYVLPYTDSFWGLLIIGIFLPFTGPIINLAWIFTGVWLQKLFYNHEKTINIVMAASLLLCAISLIVGIL